MNTKTSYVKVASHEAKKGEIKKAVLLYSGGRRSYELWWTSKFFFTCLEFNSFNTLISSNVIYFQCYNIK